MYNPYEVYYIYLDGYRIEPPIRVRCCGPSYSYGLSATYVEGFIPTLGREVFEVKLDDKYMNEVMSLIKQAEPRVTNYDELVVEDIYLTLGNNRLLTPVLVLRYNNIVFWIGIEKEHPALQSYAATTGSSYDTTEKSIEVS